jgi:arylamine N-acetyltransferase
MDERALWTRWLTDIGWGTNIVSSPVPPCEPAELAAEYHQIDPSRSLDDWTSAMHGKWTRDIFDHLEEGERPPPRRAEVIGRDASSVRGIDERALWIRWLTDIGWGTDYLTFPLPPCSPFELAAEYHRVDPSRSLEDWTREVYE